MFTLVGGLTGAATGFALTTWTSAYWPLVVGGKPIIGIPAYIVIAFEMAVLFGALATVIGLVHQRAAPGLQAQGGLRSRVQRRPLRLYVEVPADRVDEARRILEAQEPAELRVGEEAAHA